MTRAHPSSDAIAMAFGEAITIAGLLIPDNVAQGILLRAGQIDAANPKQSGVTDEVAKRAANVFLSSVADHQKGMEVDLFAMRRTLEWHAREIAAQSVEGYDRELIADMLEHYLHGLTTDAIDNAGQYLPDHIAEQQRLLREADNRESRAQTVRLSSPPHAADALDGERLDWMIAEHANLETDGEGRWRVVFEYLAEAEYFPYADSPRAAIDAARAEAGDGDAVPR